MSIKSTIRIEDGFTEPLKNLHDSAMRASTYVSILAETIGETNEELEELKEDAWAIALTKNTMRVKNIFDKAYESTAKFASKTKEFAIDKASGIKKNLSDKFLSTTDKFLNSKYGSTTYGQYIKDDVPMRIEHLKDIALTEKNHYETLIKEKAKYYKNLAIQTAKNVKPELEWQVFNAKWEIQLKKKQYTDLITEKIKYYKKLEELSQKAEKELIDEAKSIVKYWSKLDLQGWAFEIKNLPSYWGNVFKSEASYVKNLVILGDEALSSRSKLYSKISQATKNGAKEVYSIYRYYSKLDLEGWAFEIKDMAKHYKNKLMLVKKSGIERFNAIKSQAKGEFEFAKALYGHVSSKLKFDFSTLKNQIKDNINFAKEAYKKGYYKDLLLFYKDKGLNKAASAAKTGLKKALSNPLTELGGDLALSFAKSFSISFLFSAVDKLGDKLTSTFLNSVKALDDAISNSLDDISLRDKFKSMFGERGGNASKHAIMLANELGESSDYVGELSAKAAYQGIGTKDFERVMRLANRIGLLSPGETTQSAAESLIQNIKSGHDASGLTQLLGGGEKMDRKIRRSGFERALNRGDVGKALDIAEKITKEAGLTDEKYQKASNTMSQNYKRIHNVVENIKHSLTEIYLENLEPVVAKIRELTESEMFQGTIAVINKAVKFFSEKTRDSFMFILNNLNAIAAIVGTVMVAKTVWMVKNLGGIVSLLGMAKNGVAWVAGKLGLEKVVNLTKKISNQGIKEMLRAQIDNELEKAKTFEKEKQTAAEATKTKLQDKQTASSAQQAATEGVKAAIQKEETKESVKQTVTEGVKEVIQKQQTQEEAKQTVAKTTKNALLDKETGKEIKNLLILKLKNKLHDKAFIKALRINGIWIAVVAAIVAAVYGLHKMLGVSDTIGGFLAGAYETMVGWFENTIIFFHDEVPKQLELLKLKIQIVGKQIDIGARSNFIDLLSWMLDRAFDFVELNPMAKLLIEAMKMGGHDVKSSVKDFAQGIGAEWAKGKENSIDRLKNELEEIQNKQVHYIDWEKRANEAYDSNGESTVGWLKKLWEEFKENTGLGKLIEGQTDYIAKSMGQEEELRWLKAFSDRQIMHAYSSSTSNSSTVNIGGMSEQGKKEMVRKYKARPGRSAA